MISYSFVGGRKLFHSQSEYIISWRFLYINLLKTYGINEDIGKFILSIVLGGGKYTKFSLLIQGLPVAKQVA